MSPRLVVIAAHPDDETIGAAGLLLARRSALVIHVTDGAPRDPALRAHAGRVTREAYARLRREEALAALAEAGLASRDVLSLGVVDQEAPEAIARVARELAAVLQACRPRLVVTHAVEGGHPDHDATALAARAALALLARRHHPAPAVAEMAGYHQGAHGERVIGLFLPASGVEHARVLPPAAREVKRRMLAAYASQHETLAPFGVEVERFRQPAPRRWDQRPHPGPLHYEVMGWARFERLQAAACEAAAALGLGEEAC
jgi:LmbE family N-acetylglucosaminyl deacetylase